MTHLKNIPVQYQEAILLASIVKENKYQPLSLDPFLELKQSRAVLLDTEQRLKIRRKQQNRARVRINRELENLQCRSQFTKDEFICFNKFLRVNEEKRQRSRQIIECNRKSIEEKNKAMEEIREEMKDLKVCKLQMEEEVKKNSIYEQFLDKFCALYANQENFTTICTVMDRYLLYKGQNKVLSNKQLMSLQSLQTLSMQMEQCYKRYRDKLIGFYTEISRLRQLHQDVIKKTHRLELLVSDSKEKILEKYIDVKTATMSVWNLYVMMCKKAKKIPKASKSNIEEQLRFINSTMRVYQRLFDKLKSSKSVLKPKK